MPTFNHISGAEPSTVTFKLATVSQTRNSSVMHQEIMALGDPDTSNAIAAVLAGVPASTAWGLVVRQVGNSSIQGNSTVFQGTSPWVIAGNSTAIIQGNCTVVQGTSPWTIAGNSSVLIVSGNSSVTITAGNSSVIVTSGNLTSTCVQGTSPWIIAGNSTVVILSGNSSVTITAGNSSVIVTSGNITSTCVQGTNPWTIAGNSTVFQGTSPWVVADVMQSSVAPSSGSSGVVVRQVIDNILTTASTNAFASTSLTIQSSGAALRSYVTAYSILTTNAGPSKVKFYSSGTMTWPVVLAAVSSAVSGVNLAVSAPAYLFRTAASEALTLQLGGGGSTVAGWHVAVSYFRAP